MTSVASMTSAPSMTLTPTLFLVTSLDVPFKVANFEMTFDIREEVMIFQLWGLSPFLPKICGGSTVSKVYLY